MKSSNILTSNWLFCLSKFTAKDLLPLWYLKYNHIVLLRVLFSEQESWIYTGISMIMELWYDHVYLHDAIRGFRKVRPRRCQSNSKLIRMRIAIPVKYNLSSNYKQIFTWISFIFNFLNTVLFISDILHLLICFSTIGAGKSKIIYFHNMYLKKGKVVGALSFTAFIQEAQ